MKPEIPTRIPYIPPETVACRLCGESFTQNHHLEVCPACMMDAVDHCPPLDHGSDKAGAALRRFGDYDLLEVLGKGGMGIVYRARQISVCREVAVKVVIPGIPSPTFQRRFEIEAQAVARLNHPHIVPIYEVGEFDGQLFFTMPLIKGNSLKDLLKEPGFCPGCQTAPITKSRVTFRECSIATLMLKMARAVDYAHAHGVGHRDIKPSNILVDDTGEPHLVDFGLAKVTDLDGGQTDHNLTRPDHVLGTPGYMAPEQANQFSGVPLDSKTAFQLADVFSLGATLYALLAGTPPFKGGTVLETIKKTEEEEPTSLRAHCRWIHPDLETICLKCLDKDPTARYGSAALLANDLERWLEGKPIAARRATLALRANRWIRRNPVGATLIASLCAGLVVTVGLLGTREELSDKEKELSGAYGMMFGNIIRDTVAILDTNTTHVDLTSDLLDVLASIKNPKDLVAMPREPLRDPSDYRILVGLPSNGEPTALAQDWSENLFKLREATIANLHRRGFDTTLDIDLRIFQPDKPQIELLTDPLEIAADLTVASPVNFLLAEERMPGLSPIAQIPQKHETYYLVVAARSPITNINQLRGNYLFIHDRDHPSTTHVLGLLAENGMSDQNITIVGPTGGANWRESIQSVLMNETQACITRINHFERYRTREDGLRILATFGCVAKLVVLRPHLDKDIKAGLIGGLDDLLNQKALDKFEPVNFQALDTLRQAMTQARIAFPSLYALIAQPSTGHPDPEDEPVIPR